MQEENVGVKVRVAVPAICTFVKHVSSYHHALVSAAMSR